MKQTILVTGGTGFIGSHTTVELIEAGYKVVIVDDLSNSKIEVLDGIEKITGVRPAFEKVDLRDKEATENVFKKYPEIEGIIHFAASKAVGESVQKPLLYYRNNIVPQRCCHQERHPALFQSDRCSSLCRNRRAA